MFIIFSGMENGALELAKSLGGSLIVAIASILTIVISNRRLVKLNNRDLAKEELERLAAALAALRRSIPRIKGRAARIKSVYEKERKGEKVDGEAMRRDAGTVNESAREAETALTLVTITNPHGTIREYAAVAMSQQNKAITSLKRIHTSEGGAQEYSGSLALSKLALEAYTKLEEEISRVYYSKSKRRQPHSGMWPLEQLDPDSHELGVRETDGGY